MDKVPIPHHVDLGYQNPLKDQLVEVRCIDVDVIVQVRKDKEVVFKRGLDTSNIEYMIYSCTLLNDMLEMDDLEEIIPENPNSHRITVEKWMILFNNDSIPDNWFAQHRRDLILLLHLEIVYSEDPPDILYIPAGTSWGEMYEKIQNRIMINELSKEDSRKDNKSSPKDYSAVRSKPAAQMNTEKVEQHDDTVLNEDFLKDVKNILHG